MKLRTICSRFHLLVFATVFFVLINFSEACVLGKCIGMPEWERKRGSSAASLPPNSLKFEQSFPMVLQDEIHQCLPEVSDRALESGVCCGFGYNGALKCRPKLPPTQNSFLCPAIKNSLASHLRVFMQGEGFGLGLEECCLGVDYCTRNFVCRSKVQCVGLPDDREQYQDLKPKRVQPFRTSNDIPSYREY